MLAVGTARPSPEALPTGPGVNSSLWWLLWQVSGKGQAALRLSLLSEEHCTNWPSCLSPPNPQQPPTLAEGAWEGPVSASLSEVGSALRPARGCPHCCHFGGQPGCDTETPAPCLCHMNVFSGPQARPPHSEKGQPFLQQLEDTASLDHGRVLACVRKDTEGAGRLGAEPWWRTIVGAPLWEPCLQPAAWEADHSSAPDPSIDQMGEGQQPSPCCVCHVGGGAGGPRPGPGWGCLACCSLTSLLPRPCLGSCLLLLACFLSKIRSYVIVSSPIDLIAQNAVLGRDATAPP